MAGRSEQNILKTEYLKTFDTCCCQFESEHMSPEEFMPVEFKLSWEDIVTARRQAMLKGYEKYGSVKINYIFNKYLKPLDNMLARVNAYKATHNQRFLCDAFNFAMLAYWQRTTSVANILEPDVFACILRDDITEMVDLQKSITEWVNYYIEGNELGYLVIIALRIKYELQNPSDPMAYYSVEQEESPPIIGVSEIELKSRT